MANGLWTGDLRVISQVTKIPLSHTNIYHYLKDGSMKLEEVEFTDNLYSIRQKIPDINFLASRLKTKLVQDPLLLDSHGNPLEEKSLLRLVVWFSNSNVF